MQNYNAQLVLSIFPGIDLLGRGFEEEGFCVVRGPDPIWGGDIHTFHPPPHHFNGIIGGSPCQDFSKARRTPPTGAGLLLLKQYARCVTEAAPVWALLENVPTVPDLDIAGYQRQRLDVHGTECGSPQKRTRHFQFFTRDGRPLPMPRSVTALPTEPAAMAREGTQQSRRGWSHFCQVQGLPPDFTLSGMNLAARYSAVGNGVPIPMARAIARALNNWACISKPPRLCKCGCGRVLKGKQHAATLACRKRLERRRRVTLHPQTSAGPHAISTEAHDDIPGQLLIQLSHTPLTRQHETIELFTPHEVPPRP